MAKSPVFLTLERLGQNHGKYHAGGHVLNADLRSRFCLVYFTFILFTSTNLVAIFLVSNGYKSCCGNTEDRGFTECNGDFECCNADVSLCECPFSNNVTSASGTGLA